jgi:hypothetical protein
MVLLPLLITLLTCDRSDGCIINICSNTTSHLTDLHSLWGYEGPTKIITLQSQAMLNLLNSLVEEWCLNDTKMTKLIE